MEKARLFFLKRIASMYSFFHKLKFLISPSFCVSVVSVSVLSYTGLFVWFVGFLTSSSTTRLYRRRAPRQNVWQLFYVLPHMRQSWETMTSVSAGHIILTPTQPVGSGRPQRESNPGAPHQESRALPTELPRPPSYTGLTHLTNVSFSTVTDLCLKFEVCVYHQASLVYGAGCRLLRV